MDGTATEIATLAPLDALAARLAGQAGGRDGMALLAIVDHLHRLVSHLRPTPADLRAVIDFLTEVGHSADNRRQEWVLLADVIGISTLVEDISCNRPAGATPNTLAGPFYRADVPHLPLGANLSRDGKGEALAVTGRIAGLPDAAPVPGALVEVWHANAEGRYENQEPDRQPEFNLRGRFHADDAGGFHFVTIKPKGYFLPEDGPVGRLMNRLGLRLERPAHLHFRVSAPGYQVLTTHVFDRGDPAIGRDALFGVKPDLLADFHALPNDRGSRSHALDITLVLSRSDPPGQAATAT